MFFHNSLALVPMKDFFLGLVKDPTEEGGYGPADK